VEELSVVEHDELGFCEEKIVKGLRTFIEVGNALLSIRDKRLYRQGYGTFEEYCQERWSMSRAYTYRLIAAAETVNILSPIGDILPVAESQVRPLARLAPELRPVAWQRAVETAPEGKVTAAHVESVARSFVTSETPAVKLEVGQEPSYDITIERASPGLDSFFRYPGGKSKIAGSIVKEIVGLSTGDDEYREPFVGGGGVFLPVLASGKFKRLWINDLDYGIYCVWLSVHSFIDDLVERVRGFVPSVENFYSYRDILSGDCRMLHPSEVAMMKIAIHQPSYSGLGTRAGGPIGGIGQKSEYGVGCRWNAKTISSRIEEIHGVMCKSDVVITCLDYRAMMGGDKTVMYLDPPYYAKGNSLYHVGFSETDHQELARHLRNAKFPWLLSYDKCDDVRGLYAWANLRDTEQIHYSIALKGKQSRFASEYLIDGGLV
jgi:DNA adenine methylase